MRVVDMDDCIKNIDEKMSKIIQILEDQQGTPSWRIARMRSRISGALDILEKEFERYKDSDLVWIKTSKMKEAIDFLKGDKEQDFGR